MTETENKVKNHVQSDLCESCIVPFFQQANYNFFNLIEISHNCLWMILIKALDYFSVPFNIAFILCQKWFLDIFKEKVWSLVNAFLSCWGMIFIMMMKSRFFCWLMLFVVIVDFFFTDHSVVNFFHHSFWKFRINVTTNDWKKFISFCMFWQLIDNFERKLIHEFFKNILVQSYEEWEINISQVNIKFRLLILILFKRNWHSV